MLCTIQFAWYVEAAQIPQLEKHTKITGTNLRKCSGIVWLFYGKIMEIIGLKAPYNYSAPFLT